MLSRRTSGQKVEPGGPISKNIKLLITNEKTRKVEYKTQPTFEELENLSLKNLKFMSTHNSFIQPCQYGCEVRTHEVHQYLGELKNFPICIEIDLMACKVNDKIQVFHFGGITGRQYMSLDEIFEFILRELNEIEKQYLKFYPLLLSIDTTQIEKAKYKLKKCPPGNTVIVDKKDILDLFKTNFATFLHKKEGTNNDLETDLDCTLPDLINKVLIRFRHDGTNIGEKKLNKTLQFKGKIIKVDEKEYFLRVYPDSGSKIDAIRHAHASNSVENVTSEQNEIIRAASVNLNEDELAEFRGFTDVIPITEKPTYFDKTDNANYKALSVNMLETLLFGENNINCLAFNWQHLSQPKDPNKTPITQKGVIEAFTDLYKYGNPNFYLGTQLNGGGKKKTKKKRRRRKRKKKSNKKRCVKK